MEMIFVLPIPGPPNQQEPYDLLMIPNSSECLLPGVIAEVRASFDVEVHPDSTAELCELLRVFALDR